MTDPALALGGGLAESHPQITQMSIALMVGNAVIRTNHHARIGDAWLNSYNAVSQDLAMSKVRGNEMERRQ